MTAVPVVYAVARVRPGGRFTYLTPHWLDARGYLVGLLNQHAIAAAAGAVARRVPTVPPVDAWSVQVGDSRYVLGRQDLAPVPGVGPRTAPIKEEMHR